jgi:hypothetical protein
MIDEGILRERFPEIPWDQPVQVSVFRHPRVWVCRYCIAQHGLRAEGVINERIAFSYHSREQALNHIEAVHHD